MIAKRRGAQPVAALLLVVPCALAGCAPHARNLAAVRGALERGDPAAAFQKFEELGGDDGDLLYLLERGHLLHEAARYAESNEAFQRAEERADDLYTRSLTREAAALVTNEMALPYRGLPYELELVQYYRALNYLRLGQPDEALVEARKANFKLAQYADERKDDPALRQDAFLQYVTGLLYESQGEWNDASVSYRDAARLYGQYSEEYGAGAPASLDADLARAEARTGSEANVAIFLESGFVPYRIPADVTIPIFEDAKDDDPWDRATLYVDRYGDSIYAPRTGKLDHVLRFAFPKLVEVPPDVARAVVVDSLGEERTAERGLDLARVASSEFGDRLPALLLRAVARGLAKEAARAAADRKSEGLGILVNALGSLSEQADTRGWVLLPGRIDVARLKLPPGRRRVEVRFLGFGGDLLESRWITVDVPRSGIGFASVRCYR